MNIIALNGGEVPQGVFHSESTIVGADRAECLAALTGQYAYADDVGTSIRAEDGLEIYTVIGGNIL